MPSSQHRCSNTTSLSAAVTSSWCAAVRLLLATVLVLAAKCSCKRALMMPSSAAADAGGPAGGPAGQRAVRLARAVRVCCALRELDQTLCACTLYACSADTPCAAPAARATPWMSWCAGCRGSAGRGSATWCGAGAAARPARAAGCTAKQPLAAGGGYAGRGAQRRPGPLQPGGGRQGTCDASAGRRGAGRARRSGAGRRARRHCGVR